MISLGEYQWSLATLWNWMSAREKLPEAKPFEEWALLSTAEAPSYLLGGHEKRQKFLSNPLDQSTSFERDEAAMLVELCITPVD